MKKKKIHNFILKFIAGTMFILFLYSLASADSGSMVYAVTALVSLTWLFLFAVANGYVGGDIKSY